MALITTAELFARPGFDGLDSGHAAALIDDASALVRLAAAPELDAVESPATPPAVVTVVVAMVRRGFRNPMGHTQESLGDYAYSGGNNASLYLTKREAKIVRKAAGFDGARSVEMDGVLPVQPSEPVVGDEASVLP
jgi:hypothetical protein